MVIVVRAGTVYGKIMEASVFYSTTDIKAYDAGIWLRDNYADNTTVVATEVPGFWFQEFSDKNVIAQTNPIIERNTIAESVLTLSYELEHPKTLVKAYEAKGDISDENYVSLNNVWERISYSSASGNKLSFTQDGIDYKIWLSALSKQIIFDDQNPSKKIELVYSNENISLTETVLVQNITYPLIVSWTLTPLKSEVTNASLYLSTFFDLQFRFDKAQIPQFLDWVNPWSAPESIRTVGPDWAVANFSATDLKDNYLGLYDDTNNLAFAFKFNDLPDWGNIGALENRQIDAVRFQYQFKDLNVNQTDSRSYQVLTLSKNSFSQLQPESLIELFDFKSSEFTVVSRDFRDYIKENEIGFIVYDRNQLDIQMVHSKLLQLIYSNDRYAIFKIIK